MEHKITIVGIGPGSPDYLPPVAARAIAQAKVLVGGRRVLAEFAPHAGDTKVIDKDIDGVTAFIGARLRDNDVVVLVSGDPGFYSMLATLRREFPARRLEVIPGISSVQLAFARLAESWQEATLVSLHGREAEDGLPAYAAGRKLGLLTDARHAPRQIAKLLLDQGWPGGCPTWLCADLSYPAERILATTLAEAAQADGFEHCVMVVTA